MAATFRAQTEAELRAALASRCNYVLNPILKKTCLEVAASGALTTNPPPAAKIPTWAVVLAAAGAGYVLWKIWR